MRKKRILMCSEASYLSSGFSIYARETLSRLNQTGKYELAELAAYADPRDARWKDIPWRFFHVPPLSEEEAQRYNPNSLDQFGGWRFEETCLKFKPDIVWTYRDHWYDEFVERSPFRPFYHAAGMPTVDAFPQDNQWISTYMSMDAVFAYSDWGLSLLKEQSNGRMNLKSAAPAGADFEVFKPVNKQELKKAWGINPTTLILGFICRNQTRKLLPQLIEDFATFLKSAPADLAGEAYLYLHTAWPDRGWDIPKLLLEAGISNRVLFTYHCKSCGHVFAGLFQDCKCHCPQCGHPSATFPNVHLGISAASLAQVYNLFDVYVQYANSEGQGITQVEAAACGVPVMSVDYSAMSDVVRKLNGIAIKVKHLAREGSTHCHRAIPDTEDFVQKLTDLFRLPSSFRTRMGLACRAGARTHYDWDKTAQIWMDHFDSVEIKPESQTWSSQPRLHSPVFSMPQGLSNADFVRWGMQYIAGRPELTDSFTALRMTRDLNWGETLSEGMGGVYYNDASTLSTPRPRRFNREDAANAMLVLGNIKNHWEELRSKS